MIKGGQEKSVGIVEAQRGKTWRPNRQDIMTHHQSEACKGLISVGHLAWVFIENDS